MRIFSAGIICLIFNCIINSASSQSFTIKYDSVPCLNGASIRGMSVVDDSVAWISGSKGTVAQTINGGRTWERIDVKGFAKRDFRSIYAFDKNNVYIANAGDSATVLVTHNGGKTWFVFLNIDSPGAFIDGISFWEEEKGLILSDPVNGKFPVFYYSGGEINASESPNLTAIQGEACFAASGTCLKTSAGGLAWFVSGGTQSRLFFSKDFGKNWKSYPCPLIQGQSSQGAFSVLFTDSLNGIVVGGDYGQAELANKNCAITKNGGRTWISPKVPPNGYRSCVESIAPAAFISTGISGTDYSTDGGITWKNFDKQSFNVVQKAKQGNLILIAGDKGRVGIVSKK
jgi:photosystem II stability/assembly factor-like uncharacterized protein